MCSVQSVISDVFRGAEGPWPERQIYVNLMSEKLIKVIRYNESQLRLR